LFLFFHKHLCGPLANSCFHHPPNPQDRPDSRLEVAYHRADSSTYSLQPDPPGVKDRRRTARSTVTPPESHPIAKSLHLQLQILA
jgi:hypothetical protein